MNHKSLFKAIFLTMVSIQAERTHNWLLFSVQNYSFASRIITRKLLNSIIRLLKIMSATMEGSTNKNTYSVL